MTKILFCGTSVPDQVELQMKSISAAGNRFQNNMIDTLISRKEKVMVLSYLAFPIDTVLHRELEKAEQYDYIIRKSRKIIPFLKSLAAFRRKITADLEGQDLVICYNVCYAWFPLPALAKKKHVKSAVILADYSDTDSFHSVFSKCYAILQKNCFRKFDTVIGLSQYVAGHLKKDQKFLLMEGGIQQQFYDRFDRPDSHISGKIRILYSGLLSRVTGVDLLIHAMHAVYGKCAKQGKQMEAELILTGKGDLEQYVLECEEKYTWLHYSGHLAYEEYIRMLQNADILVNPRNMTLPENKNNFPSKIMDYLATGKYVVSTRFAGYERFQPYVSFTEESRLEEAIEEAVRVTAEESRETAAQRYQKNRAFAAEFLWDRQVERILQDTGRTQGK